MKYCYFIDSTVPSISTVSNNNICLLRGLVCRVASYTYSTIATYPAVPDLTADLTVSIHCRYRGPNFVYGQYSLYKGANSPQQDKYFDHRLGVRKLLQSGYGSG